MKKIIIYDASTSYMLMVAWITAAFSRSEYTNILFLNTVLFENPFLLRQRILETSVFNDVILVNDRPGIQADSLIETICKPDDIAYYHFASYGSHYAISLFHYCEDRSIPIILNEEGGATYLLYESYAAFYEKFSQYHLNFIDLENIFEIWVFNKSLYQSQAPHKVKEIELWKHLTSHSDIASFTAQLNHVFNYTHCSLKIDTIFFTQNFYAYGGISVEEQLKFYEKIAAHFNNDIVFKIHPSESFSTYANTCLKIVNYPSSVPWEVILLNIHIHGALDHMTFVSVLSTAIFSQQIFFHKNPPLSKSISLYHLSPDAIQKIVGKNRFKQFVSLAKTFNHFHAPKTNQELFDILRI